MGSHICPDCGGQVVAAPGVVHDCPVRERRRFEARLQAIVDQPPPIPNGTPAIWALVIADMEDRDNTGLQRYGTRLQAHNGRDALVDAYQEALDLVVYLRQAIAERDG